MFCQHLLSSDVISRNLALKVRFKRAPLSAPVLEVLKPEGRLLITRVPGNRKGMNH